MLLGMAVDPANGKKEGEKCCESESSVMPFCCLIFLESYPPFQSIFVVNVGGIGFI